MADISYLSVLTSEPVKDPSRYQEVIDSYKKGDYNLENDVLYGVKSRDVLETADLLRMQLLFSTDKSILKNIVKYYKKNNPATTSIFSYIPSILNELGEESNILCDKIVCNYEKGIKELDSSSDELVQAIRSRFVPDNTNLPDNPRDYIDQFGDEFIATFESIVKEYDQEMEALENLSEAVTAGDRAAKSLSIIDKSIKAVEDSVNRVRKLWDSRRKEEHYDRYMNDNWRLKRKLTRALLYGTVALASPIVSALIFFYNKIFDWKKDTKYRRQAVGDLKLEISIIDEKIGHADSDGNRAAKIKLMRERDRLARVLTDLEAGRKG